MKDKYMMIDVNKFLTHIIWGKIMDEATCGQIKKALEDSGLYCEPVDIPEIVSEQWVDIHDKYPEGNDFDCFIVCNKHGVISIEQLWYISDPEWNDNIIAWMPLPVPYYKGMEHEEDN